MHISFTFAKILWKTNFQPQEFPPSGSKAKDGREEKRDWLVSFINVTDWYKYCGCHVMKIITTTYIDALHGIIHYQWGQQWACQSRQIMGRLVGCHNDYG